MAEFKRKFIINDPNFIKFIEKHYSTTNKIYQFYHFSDSIIIRVSKMESHDGDDNNLLIRIPNQQFKRDIEINITDNEYRSFLKFLNPHKILTRTRHRIYEFGYDIFVDIFEKDYDFQYVYDFSVKGNETFALFSGIVVHNTLNTFHKAKRLAKLYQKYS